MRHHAYVTNQEPTEVLANLTKEGVVVRGNPDVLCLNYTDLSVDDARQITTYAFLKSIGESKYFVVSFERAGVEAQNALLKVVEEAPGNTVFYFCTPQPGGLLPTLLSRCIPLSTSEVDRADTTDARAFLKLGYPERLAQVEKLVSAAQKSGDRTELRNFMRSLVHAHPARATLDAARYLDQNGSSPKLVLSHLAVVLPVL